MEVFRDIGSVPYKKNSFLTVGTFDGVHSGHRKIIHVLNEQKEKTGARGVVVTFDPHPQIVLKNKTGEVKLLTTTPEKLDLLEETGVDAVVIINFTKEFSQTSAVEFYENYLIGKIGLNGLVLGYDHMFGKNREGNYETLKTLSGKFKFDVVRIGEFKIDSEHLSSTSIRHFLAEGNITEANKLLGYKYSFSGNVIHGNKLGRTIGFPTANIKPDSEYKLLPKDGVYAVTVKISGKEHSGMMNIGVNPTVTDENVQRIEVSIFDFDNEIYGERITVSFADRIRDELKFDSVDQLISEMNNDKQKVLEVFHK